MRRLIERVTVRLARLHPRTRRGLVALVLALGVAVTDAALIWLIAALLR